MERADRFTRHPSARVFDGQGRVTSAAVPGRIVGGDRPAVPALLAAIAAPGVFRIGAEGASPPAPGQVPMLETLTSGTSGEPRRIWRTQASWCAGFALNAGLFGIGPGVSVAVPGRLSHSLALYGAVEALCLGADLHLLDGLRPDRQRQAMAARDVAVCYAAPAHLRLLAEAGGPPLPRLRLMLVGGSKLDPGLRAALAEMAPGAQVREFYGTAEASFITLAGPDDPADSVGRPYPGVRIALRQRDSVVEEGAVGQIWVQSPYLFTGYANDEAGAGAAVWRDGWLSVGEVGRMQGGCLFLLGRTGRMVTVADQNVFPEAVEAVIQRLHGVMRVAVIPVADPLRGHVLIAVIRGDRAQEKLLLAAARAAFGPLIAPRRVLWRDDWPELASGKTDLAAIAREAGG